MKIAYITGGDPYDKHSWSGTNYYMRKALEDLGHEVYCIWGFSPRDNLITKAKKFFSRISGGGMQTERTIEASKQWAQYIKSRLHQDTDAIFSLGTVQIAHLKVDIPIYVFVDGVFEQLRNLHNWSMFSPYAVKEANKLEQLALNNCASILTCSKVTKTFIEDYYKTPSTKTNLVLIGANMDELPTEEEVQTFIREKLHEKCKILFVGVQWKLKGMDIVLDTYNELKKRDFQCELHLCGLRESEIPAGFEFTEGIYNHGFLKKDNNKDLHLLQDLYKTSHFLFVPTYGDAYGLVFCEANSYGVPVVTHNVDGPLSIVNNEENGHLFNVGTSASVFADYIMETFTDKACYQALANTSYLVSKTKLSWKVAAERINEIITLNP